MLLFNLAKAQNILNVTEKRCIRRNGILRFFFNSYKVKIKVKNNFGTFGDLRKNFKSFNF